jgi:dTDP-4-amino-4,6-dideoxygalactose transaminase
VATTPVVPDGVRSAWAQYTIRVPERDGVAKALADAGVPTAVYYPLPLHRQQAYAHHPVGAGGMAESDRAADEVLSLPMHPYLGSDDQGLVIDALRTCLAEVARP